MMYISQIILLSTLYYAVCWQTWRGKPNWILHKPKEHFHPKPETGELISDETTFWSLIFFAGWYVCGVVLALSLGSMVSIIPVPRGSLHPSSPDQHTGFCHQSLSKENQDRGFPGKAAAPLHFENLWASLFGNDSTLLSASPYSQCRHVWRLRDTHQASWGLQTPAVGPDADLKAFDVIVNELTDIIIVHIIA